MLVSIKNHCLSLIFLMLILSSCKLQEPNKTHGIVFLENRANKLLINKTNKNDVIKIIGYPQIKDDFDINTWIYLERTFTRGKFHKLGKNILKDNNILIIKFDKYGIIKNKDFLKKDDLKNIKFSDKVTKNDVTEKSFVQSFLESIRQKMYSNKR